MTVSDARRGELAVGGSERIARDVARAAGGPRARLGNRDRRGISGGLFAGKQHSSRFDLAC